MVVLSHPLLVTQCVSKGQLLVVECASCTTVSFRYRIQVKPSLIKLYSVELHQALLILIMSLFCEKCFLTGEQATVTQGKCQEWPTF